MRSAAAARRGPGRWSLSAPAGHPRHRVHLPSVKGAASSSNPRSRPGPPRPHAKGTAASSIETPSASSSTRLSNQCAGDSAQDELQRTNLNLDLQRIISRRTRIRLSSASSSLSSATSPR